MATENGFFTNQTQFQNDPNVSQRDSLKGFYGASVRPAYIEDLVAKAEEAAAKSYEYSQDAKQYRDETKVLRDETQVLHDDTEQTFNNTVQVYNDTVGIYDDTVQVYNDTVDAKDLTLTYRDQAQGFASDASQSADESAASAADAAAIVPALQADIDSKVSATDQSTVSDADTLFADGKHRITTLSNTNVNGLSGVRALFHMQASQGGFQLAARTVGHEVHVRAADLNSGSIGTWSRLYTTEYKPTAADVGAYTTAQVDAIESGLQSQITTLDGEVVKTSGDQSISGNKIFTTNVITNTIRSTVGGDQGMIMFGGGSTRIGGSGSSAGVQLRPNGMDTGNLDNDYFSFKPSGLLHYEGSSSMSIANNGGGNSVSFQNNGRITLSPGTDNTVDSGDAALYYGRSYCNTAAGGSWGHSSFAATALLNTNSNLAYNVFKMGSDGPKMMALGEGGSTVRLYPGGGNANFTAWLPHVWTHYYTGTSPMSWDMFAETANVNSSIRMREDGSNHGVEFGYAGASNNNEFFINMRQNGSDNRAMSIYRDRTRAIFNTNRLDVESSGAEKMLLYRSDGDANVNIRYSSSIGNDVWAGKTNSNFAIGNASDLSTDSNQWMIIGGGAATFRVPVVLGGGSPSSSHAIRRDWAEDNLFRRNVGLVSSQDWNTLVNSGGYRVGGSVGSNHPNTPTVGPSYNYGSLLTINDINATNGVKAHLYFPHNQGSPDTASRLPVYRSGYTGDYGNWRTLLTLQYGDIRYTQVSSDERLKTDIKKVEGALDMVEQIGSYSYTKENSEVTQIIKEDGEYLGSDEQYKFEMGFLAQEVEKILPHVISENAQGYKAIKSNDNTLLAVAYQAIRELNEENKQLKDRLAAIEAHLGLGE